MKQISKIIFSTLLVFGFTIVVQAQEDRSPGMIKSALIGLEYQVKAGLSIGGTAPLPMPVEIRAINGFNPTMLFSIEGNATKWLKANERWGGRVGLRIESQGMITHSTVRNYGMTVKAAGGGVIPVGWTVE